MSDKIIHAEYVASNVHWKACPHPQNHEYAFTGRSNVGKSSLINMLCNRKKLAHVSKTPGKTKTINHYLINGEWNLVDLPGYGYAKIAQSTRGKWLKILDDYLKKRSNLVNTFVLIDINVPPQKIDMEFVDYLGGHFLPFSIVFTKTDKLSKNKLNQSLDAYKKELYKNWEHLPPFFLSSALMKSGIDEILEYIFSLNNSIVLNKE
jgi:GTP-binding protein